MGPSARLSLGISLASKRLDRRLSAVLAADVAGYGRLVSTDEEGTIGQLKAHRALLFDPKLAEHNGRLVKTTGDGLLAEFASVVDAVRCVRWMCSAGWPLVMPRSSRTTISSATA